MSAREPTIINAKSSEPERVCYELKAKVTYVRVSGYRYQNDSEIISTFENTKKQYGKPTSYCETKALIFCNSNCITALI